MRQKVKTITITIAGIILFSGSSMAQSPNTTPKRSVGNPAKRPPAVKAIFAPDLRLRGSESVEINLTVPKTYHKITFLFENWDQFPTDQLKPSAEPPSSPPNPCKQVKTSTRLFAILHSKNGATIGCTELKPQEDFFFMFEQDEVLPPFVYVTVVDRTQPGILKSSLVSPSSGATK
ncbi:MAG: hypothetical protein ABIP75_03855 [Pyrinomonadaceae bacterium]